LTTTHLPGHDKLSVAFATTPMFSNDAERDHDHLETVITIAWDG
jgi:hypothetical protein